MENVTSVEIAGAPKTRDPGCRSTGRIHVRRRSDSKRVSASERYGRMTMAVNSKLTHAVKYRVVQSFRLNGSELLIDFVDGSTMKVTIAEYNSPSIHERATIRQISEDRRSFFIRA
jgi:hypothetical protein